MSIEIKSVSKRFGEFVALQNIDLNVANGELIALLGPSGSGKTTLLRIIAGLENADCGVVYFGDKDITNLNLRDRQIGFVFQHYALFNHMNVFENIAFGLRVKPRKLRFDNKEITNRVMELLELIQLKHLSKHYPNQLSGGQRQRVALARALAIEPKVLLLDEPFGALDAQVRKNLRQWLKNLHTKFQLTTIFVTHDQDEAFELANRIVIINQGKVEQIDTPGNICNNPATNFVKEFVEK
jgi:sulfate transport system ATP-binding protein